MAGFVVTIGGIGVLLAMVSGTPSAWAFAPGLLLIGLGLGVMLTPSVNVVQSSFGEEQQGEISGLSRSVSNLGSSLGHRDRRHDPRRRPHASSAYALAMITLAVIGLIGLVAAAMLPRQPVPGATPAASHEPA